MTHKKREGDNLASASETIREETIPALLKAYDKEGPMSVLALGVMVADIWLASGFSIDDWPKLIILADALERHPEAS